MSENIIGFKKIAGFHWKFPHTLQEKMYLTANFASFNEWRKHYLRDFP